ncbi:hypothetical protein F5I97DRAFT_1866477 [Phlebopus sp. FC_14]|nr:hypothetical protein F5I97DRAFT_1866477 [Phlebopus sp. FC_14]
MSVNDQNLRFQYTPKPRRLAHYLGSVDDCRTFTPHGWSAPEDTVIITVSAHEFSNDYLLCYGTFRSEEVLVAFASDPEVVARLRAQGHLVPRFHGLYSAQTTGNSMFCFVIEKYGDYANDVCKLSVAFKCIVFDLQMADVASRIKMMRSLLSLHKNYEVCHEVNKWKVLFRDEEIRFIGFDEELDDKHECLCPSDFFELQAEGGYNLVYHCKCENLAKAAASFFVLTIQRDIKGASFFGDLPDTEASEHIVGLFKGIPPSYFVLGGINKWLTIALERAQKLIRNGQDYQGLTADSLLSEYERQCLSDAISTLESNRMRSSGASGEVQYASGEYSQDEYV